MLLSYRGRRSGRRFVTPIGYFPCNDGVPSLSSAHWWVNIRDRQPVELLVRRNWHPASPTGPAAGARSTSAAGKARSLETFAD